MTQGPEGRAIGVVDVDHEVTGNGPPLVLLHGITEDRRTWAPLVPELGSTHEVLTVDLRGHGASPVVGPYDLGTMAADVYALVDGLGWEAPLVVGHSLGGTVALAYAARFLTRGVLCVDQPLDLVRFQAQVHEVEPILRSDGFAAVIDGLFTAMRGPLPDSEVGRVEAIRTPRQEVLLGVWAPVLDLASDELEAMVDDLAAQIDVPFLSLHGITPRPGYEGWLSERISGAEVEVWEEHGHYPHLVDPHRFLERLRRFDPLV